MSTRITPARHYPAAIGDQSILWLLTIEYDGEGVRLSTADVDIIDSETGQTLHYFGTLGNLRYSEPATFPQDVSEGVSVAINTTMPISVARLEAEGHRLEGSRAELARWIRGTDFSERRIIAIGEISDPTWGADNEPITFSVESVVWRDTALVPTENQRITSTTWSTVTTLDPEEAGLYYPLVIGRPGKVSTGIVARGWITGSQGAWVERDRNAVVSGVGTAGYDDLQLLIAGHPVAATRVYLSTNENPSGERFTVQQGPDARGQIVSYVDATQNNSTAPSSVGDFQITDPDGNQSYGLGVNGIDVSYRPGNSATEPGVKPIYCAWFNDSEDGGGEGGLIGPSGSLVRNAIEVIEVLLGYTRRPIDRGRFAAVRPLSAGFLLDFVIDAQTQPWPFIRDQILPLLPVSIVVSPSGGLAPIWWRFDAAASDAVAHLDAGVNPYIQGASTVQVDSSEIKNDFTLDYALSIRKQTHYGIARLGAGPYDTDDPDTEVSLHCRLSQQRYRYVDGTPRVSEEHLVTDLVYDKATARAILSWRARAYALARRKIAYVVPERDFGWLERGAVVTLTDPDLFIDGWVCLVTDVQLDDSGVVGLELLRVEDPPRDGLRHG